jgi:hypothetical protein
MSEDPLALVVFPHPDDEVFFCATLRRFHRAGRPARVIYVTAGGLAPSGQRPMWLGRSLAALGLEGCAVDILGFPDRGCIDRMGHLKAVLAHRVQELRPQAVYTVAFEGGHPDHDACHWAVVEATKSCGWGPEVFEFPTYHRGGLLFRAGVLLSGEGAVARTPLSRDDLRLKTEVLRRHGMHGALLKWFLDLFLDREELAKGEAYRPVPARSYLTRPHPGRLGYELYTRYRFPDFRRMVEEYQD